MGRKTIAAGNWKMNTNVADGVRLYTNLCTKLQPTCSEVVVFPPATHLGVIGQISRPDFMSVGAQNISEHAKGAYTGEISGGMISSTGASYVLVGHSERRGYQKESNSLLAAKAKAALEHGLTPIFCCGEALDIRQSGEHVSFVVGQLKDSFADFTAEDVSKMVLAYEPIWAIGTGETASPEQAQEMHKAIRSYIAQDFGADIAENMTILYGGSVKSANAKEIFAKPDVDGGLVGGASLDADHFAQIAASF